MTRLNNLSKKHKHEMIIFVAFLIIIILVEIFVFNRGFLFTKILKLEERHYSVNEGNSYQFNLVDGNLVAQNNDPNITFDNINIPIGAISIKCVNSIPEAVGQIFYRDSNVSFNETDSVQYNANLADKTFFLSQILGLPKIVTVSSLRFDLTNTPGDVITCDEFIINPKIPFSLSHRRLATYVGLFFLSTVLLIFQNTKSRLNNKILFILIFITLSVILSIKLIPFAASQNGILIVVLCILLFSLALTYILMYLYKESRSSHNQRKGILEKYKYEIALAVMLITTTLPLLTESYFYYDDWWNIGNKTLLTKQNLLAFGRPIQLLVLATFDEVNIRNAYVFKWVFLLAIILYTILLFRWLLNKTKKKDLSFLLAGVLGVFSPVIDLLGYTASGAFTFSLLFSSMSVICFDQAYASYKQRANGKLFFYSVISSIMIFTACLAYQIGPQIAFLFLTIDLYFDLKQSNILTKNFFYLILFALSNGFYLFFIKFLNQFYNTEIVSSRSQFIRSIPEISEKLHFYRSIIRQSILQIETALTGNEFVLERYHGYFTSLANNQVIGNLIFYFIIIMILIAFVRYWIRTKNIFGLITLIINIPLSYYAFLLLSENGYLTYYAFAHISIFMFYFLMGLITSVQFFWNKIIPIATSNIVSWKLQIGVKQILIPILLLCALVSNIYGRDFYINYNSQVYSFVKNSIQTYLESDNLKRIHVIGTISPLNADVYSRFVVETALRDLGVDPDNYNVTFSKNKNYLARIEEIHYFSILENISSDDKIVLENFYVFDPTYRQYNLKKYPSVQDQITLYWIFTASGVIPQNTAPDTLVIDLTWTDHVYYNIKNKGR